ncbi:hypothetical protein [Candidatus Nitrosotalea bavarica]|jgi:hypothetical protein|uniref:hypothetical protein n=1 Tax=Candidatus Nitrosotalea bavarica TaxID=1903277 RepID=UPI0013FE2D1C|nr:hypothetical protein [Candidatus Nitrosotalea bavarica]
MTEADITIFIATAVTLVMTIAIYFGERAHRYNLAKKGKTWGTYGMRYEGQGHA